MSVVLGTSGVVFAVLPAYAPDPQARVHVFCHAVPGTWHAMGVMLSAAGSLAWLRHAVGARLRRARRGGGPLGARRRRACCSRRTSRASARRTPTPTRAARSPASRSGTTAARSRARRSRASPTGCATRSSCCATLGVAPGASAAPRAAARASDLWLRIVASVLGLPLERTESEEGSAFGAALLAGVRAGVFADAADAVARCVRVRDRIEPDPEWSAAYERGYERYRLLYPTLRPLEDASRP